MKTIVFILLGCLSVPVLGHTFSTCGSMSPPYMQGRIDIRSLDSCLSELSKRIEELEQENRYLKAKCSTNQGSYDVIKELYQRINDLEREFYKQKDKIKKK